MVQSKMGVSPIGNGYLSNSSPFSIEPWLRISDLVDQVLGLCVQRAMQAHKVTCPRDPENLWWIFRRCLLEMSRGAGAEQLLPFAMKQLFCPILAQTHLKNRNTCTCTNVCFGILVEDRRSRNDGFCAPHCLTQLMASLLMTTVPFAGKKG